MNSSVYSIEKERDLRLGTDDPRLADFASINLNVAAIADWVNSPGLAVRRRRIQFMGTLPVLVPMLVFYPDDIFTEEIIGWVDGGEPIIENIAGLMGDVRTDTVQYLIEKPISQVSGRWIGDELELLFALDCLSPDQRPQSEMDWAVFSSLQEIIRPVPWDASGHVFRDLCSKSYENAYAECLDLTNDDLTRLGLINDYISFFDEWVASAIELARKSQGKVISLAARAGRRGKDSLTHADIWTTQFLSNYSAVALYRQALSWRDAYQDAVTIAQMESNDPELVQWPALLRKPFIAGDIRVVSLTSLEELMTEGAALRSHVRNHVKSCMLGDSHFVSLRDGHDHQHISTAAFHLMEPENGLISLFSSAHHRPSGEYAYPAEDEALDAVQHFLKHPDQQPWLQALVEFHATRQDRIQEKLSSLEKMDYEASCSVISRVLDNYKSAIAQLLGSIS